MKALSLWQPHAAAIALGLKPWETRDWPTRYRGPLAIHAAKRAWDDGGEWHALAGALIGKRIVDVVVSRFPELAGQARCGEVARIVRDRVLVFGSVVCTVDLVDCVPTHELRGKIGEREFWGDFSDGAEGNGRYAFRLENVRILARPLPWRGMQGFFEVELGGQASAIEAPLQQQLDLFGGIQ